MGWVGQQSTAYLKTPGLIPSVPEFFSEEKKLRCVYLGESEQWIENVVPTHLGLVSGKLVLQKSNCYSTNKISQRPHHK